MFCCLKAWSYPSAKPIQVPELDQSIPGGDYSEGCLSECTISLGEAQTYSALWQVALDILWQCTFMGWFLTVFHVNTPIPASMSCPCRWSSSRVRPNLGLSVSYVLLLRASQPRSLWEPMLRITQYYWYDLQTCLYSQNQRNQSWW